MPLITPEQKKLDPDLYDHLKAGDYFHTENPVKCGVCGCESDYWEIVRWMAGTKLHLICPGNEVNRELHQKIDRKKELLYKDVLPASVMKELELEIIGMMTQIQAEVAVAVAAKFT